MNKVIVFALLCVSISICSAALSDADEAADGYLTVGEYDGSHPTLEDFEELVVMGGGSNWIDARNYSYIEVQYTSSPEPGWNDGGIKDITLYDNSELLYLGGITEEITVRDNATAILQGGRIDGITLYDHPSYSHEVVIYCRPGYQMDSSGISGLWEDGTSFDIDFINVGSPYPPTWQGIDIIEVPEPATLALLGLGGLLIRRKKTFK